jgi:hypothetical protein
MLDSRRNRIVIDFNNKLPGVTRARSKGRLSRILLLLTLVAAVVIVIVLAAAFFWWRHYKTTPAYSLALLVDAVHREDLNAVDQIVNGDKISAGLSNEISDRVAGRYGLAFDDSVRQRVESLMPALMPRIKQTVRDELVKGMRDASKESANRPFPIVALTLPYAVKITSEGDNAKVTLPNNETELSVERNGGRWQIVGIKDSSLVQRIVDQLSGDLPAIAAPLDQLSPGRPPGSRPRRRRRR